MSGWIYEANLLACMTQAPWRRLSNKFNPLHLWAVCSVSPGAQPGHPDHLSKRAPRREAPGKQHSQSILAVTPCEPAKPAPGVLTSSGPILGPHSGSAPLRPVSSLLSASPTGICGRTDPLLAGLGFILLYASAFPTQSLDQSKVSPHISKGSHMTTTGG